MLANVGGMDNRLRIRIAALASAVFIGGLSVAGIAARHQTVAQPAAASQTQHSSIGGEGVEFDGE